jgi:O-antigen/teichoic acid export membrane protein
MSLRGWVGSLRSRLLPDGELQARAIQSGFWLGTTNVLDRALQLLLLLVLTRVLSPRQFGLMGIALVSVGALNSVSNLGVNAAIIHESTDALDRHLDTAWVLEVARYALTALLLVLGAPLVGRLFGEPAVVPLLRVVALAPLARGFKNPGIVAVRKELEYHRYFVYRTSGSVAQFVVGVAWALVSPTVWALVAAFVAADVTRTVASYLVHDYRPGRAFDLGVARDLVGYGKWVTGSSILVFLYSQGDDVLVGALLTASALGFYQLAYRFSNAPATELSEVVAEITFPAMSKLQDDPRALRTGFLRVLKLTSLVAFPAAAGIAVTARPFVAATLGREWLPMVPAMQLLATYGLLRAIGLTFQPVWKAVGRPDYQTKLSVVRIALLAVLLVPATTRFGIVGTASVLVAVSVVPMLPLNVAVTVRTIDVGYGEVFAELAYPLVATAAMAGAVLAVRTTLAATAVLEFPVLVLTGIVTYALAVVLVDTTGGWGLERTLQDVLGSVSV